MFKKILIYTFPLFFVILSLALEPHELGQPWAEIAQLKESRDYDTAVKKLLDYANKSSNVEILSEIYYQIGNIYHEYTHNYDKGLAAYQSILDLSKKVKSPSELEPYLGLARMSIADIYRRTGRYDEAIRMYKKVVEDYPGTGYVSVAVRDISGIQDALAGIRIQQQIIDNYPDTEFAAEAQFEIAELYFSSQGLNNPLRAIEEYRQLIQKYADSSKAAEAQLKIGNIYRVFLHDPDKAIESYQRLLQGSFASSKISSEALFRIGRTYYTDLENYNKALETFDKLLREYPSYWRFLAVVYWKAMCHEQIGDYENAIKTFEMFVQLYPEDDLGLLADIGRLGERNVKTRIVSKIQELKNLAPEMLWKQAERLRAGKRYTESLNIYYDLVTNYPDSQYASKARTQSEQVSELSEIQIIRQLVKKGSIESPSAQYRIADIYETGLNDYPGAIVEYEKVVANYPGTSWAAGALYRMGLIYSGMNYSSPGVTKKRGIKPNYNKAIEKFRLLIGQYPKTYKAADAYYRIGEIYRVRLKDYKQAIAAYEKVLNDYPRRPLYVGEGYKDSIADESLFKIGRIYYENLNNQDMAMKTFSRFLKEYPDSCRKAAAYSFIASIQEKRKDSKDAINSLEQIISIVDKSDTQTSFFMRDALYTNSSSSANHQDDIIKEIKRRILRLQGQN